MSITIRMTKTLRDYTNCRGSIEVNGTTVGECLSDLIRQYPSSKKWLFDRDGRLLVLIRINEETTVHHKDGLTGTVVDGDELYLFLVLGGG